MSSTYYAFCHNENKILTFAYIEIHTNIINLPVIIIVRDYVIKMRLKLKKSFHFRDYMCFIQLSFVKEVPSRQMYAPT